jgi:hypothetical protein
MSNNNFNIWEGVYENWDNAPGDKGFLESDVWVKIPIIFQRKTLWLAEGMVSYSMVLRLFGMLAGLFVFLSQADNKGASC